MLTPLEQSAYDLVLAGSEVITQAQIFQDQLACGQEGLLTDLSDTFQKFLTWLKQKVLDLFHKFISFVKHLKLAILGLLSNRRSTFIQSITSKQQHISSFDDKEIFIPYDVGQIFEHLDSFYRRLPIRVSSTNEMELHKSIGDWYQIWNELVQKRDRTVQILKSKCCSTCRRIVDYLNFLEVRAIALSENINEVRYLIDRATSVTDVAQLTTKLIRGVAPLVQFDNSDTSTFLFVSDASPRAVSDLKNVVLACIKSMGYVAVTISNILEPLPGIMITIGKIYDSSRYKLHYTTTIDPELHRHIEHIIGATVDVAHIVVTTKEPNTWPTNDDNVIIGWCHASYGSVGARDLWVNARYLLRDLSPDGMEQAAYLLLTTVVHECTHLSDGQNYKVFDPERNNNTRQEIRAYAAESKYAPTLRELTWARTQIKTMIARMK